MTLSKVSRRDAVRAAFLIEWATLAWMIIEATIAIGSGILAHSITLIAFGADSLIELVSAGVLIWRLDVELRRAATFSEGAERRAARIGGVLLYALALYIVLSVLWSLLHRQGELFSIAGFALALLAIPIMYLLSKNKLRLAERIGSRALRADAVESITCGYLSFVVVIGLLAQLLLHVWWMDAATSLAIVYFVLKEAREAWSGEVCGCDETVSSDLTIKPSDIAGA